jgi:hypothetical protein
LLAKCQTLWIAQCREFKHILICDNKGSCATLSRSSLTTKKKKDQATANPSDSNLDSFLLEAMKRFQAGEIDEATTMGLMKMAKKS